MKPKDMIDEQEDRELEQSVPLPPESKEEEIPDGPPAWEEVANAESEPLPPWGGNEESEELPAGQSDPREVEMPTSPPPAEPDEEDGTLDKEGEPVTRGDESTDNTGP